MENFIIYLIKSSLSMVILYISYKILFTNRAYFGLQRFILFTVIGYGFVGPLAAQLLCPVIMPAELSINFHSLDLSNIHMSFNGIISNGVPVEQETRFPVWIVIYLYFAGSIVMLLRLLSHISRLLFQYIKLGKHKQGNFVFIKLPKGSNSFSFFHILFIEEEFFSKDGEKNQIVEHEKIHARQMHSIDLLMAELLIVFQWFNPFVYLLRNAIIENNEFFTDKKTLEKIPEIYQYKLLLLNNVLPQKKNFPINNFSYSLIKKRIKMMKKTKSQLKFWLSSLSFLMMFAMVTVSFANQTGNIKNPVVKTKTVKISNQLKMPVTDTVKKAQKQKSDVFFTVVEHMPEFPGGMKGLMKYLIKNIKYPKKARKNKVSGRVFVNFIIEKDGSISNIKILKGLGDGCNEEVIRVIKKMPKWKPGKQSGKAVRVSYNLPVKFSL